MFQLEKIFHTVRCRNFSFYYRLCLDIFVEKKNVFWSFRRLRRKRNDLFCFYVRLVKHIFFIKILWKKTVRLFFIQKFFFLFNEQNQIAIQDFLNCESVHTPFEISISFLLLIWRIKLYKRFPGCSSTIKYQSKEESTNCWIFNIVYSTLNIGCVFGYKVYIIRVLLFIFRFRNLFVVWNIRVVRITLPFCAGTYCHWQSYFYRLPKLWTDSLKKGFVIVMPARLETFTNRFLSGENWKIVKLWKRGL